MCPFRPPHAFCEATKVSSAGLHRREQLAEDAGQRADVADRDLGQRRRLAGAGPPKIGWLATRRSTGDSAPAAALPPVGLPGSPRALLPVFVPVSPPALVGDRPTRRGRSALPVPSGGFPGLRGTGARADGDVAWRGRGGAECAPAGVAASSIGGSAAAGEQGHRGAARRTAVSNRRLGAASGRRPGGVADRRHGVLLRSEADGGFPVQAVPADGGRHGVAGGVAQGDGDLVVRPGRWPPSWAATSATASASKTPSARRSVRATLWKEICSSRTAIQHGPELGVGEVGESAERLGQRPLHRGVHAAQVVGVRPRSSGPSTQGVSSRLSIRRPMWPYSGQKPRASASRPAGVTAVSRKGSAPQSATFY